ncbi:Uncharacterised protein [Chromobacterium violaceum]|uniref:Uncharacterized protein n=1 Tax=Chromobacterium violaceum TaxID=536 RepID=A0A3S4J1G1_CHRVL|nr:Uncharacterised protein [Chromobacterium violaceum]
MDGEVAVLGQKVLPHNQIEIDKKAQDAQSARVTILLNKPVGYVSGQAEDGYLPAAALIKPENRWPRMAAASASSHRTCAAWRPPVALTSTPSACWC